MKFEDLKLPPTSSVDFVYRQSKAPDLTKTEGVVHLVAHWVYEQMHAHYEAKLAEANKCPQPAPAWRLPDPPPGQQWHRDDWTQDMLVDAEGNQYRPLLLEECQQAEDEYLRSSDQAWRPVSFGSNQPSRPTHLHRRTRRPLPAPVEYVPLGPEDVPPGSAVRKYDEQRWDLVTSVDSDSLWVQGNCHPW